MTFNLNLALQSYEINLSSLEQANIPSPELILEVFIIRDEIQTELVKQNRHYTSQMMNLLELDHRLEEVLKLIPKKTQKQELSRIVKKITEYRDLIKPPQENWWWFVQMPIYWSDKLDFVWDTLSIVWLAVTLSLFTDISSRFLSGGLGLWGSFIVVPQTILTVVGSGALTKTGQKIVDNNLKRWRIPRNLWQEVKFGGATLLLFFFIIFRFSLPKIAVFYNNYGYKDYQAGQLNSAESKYLKALELNPDYTAAHYNLGVVYEDLQNLSKARNQYNLAVQTCFPPANNNLARLYILGEEKNYPVAVNLLLKGFFLLEQDCTKGIKGKEYIRYSLGKNLGWVRLKQKRYEQAKDALQTAIEIPGVEKQASAHCLLAQTLEKLEEETKALEEWVKCDKYPRNPNNPEEDEWIYLAKQKLKEADLK